MIFAAEARMKNNHGDTGTRSFFCRGGAEVAEKNLRETLSLLNLVASKNAAAKNYGTLSQKTKPFFSPV